MKVLKFLNNGIFPGHTLLSVGNSHAEIMTFLQSDHGADGDWELGMERNEVKVDHSRWLTLMLNVETEEPGYMTHLPCIIIREFDFSDEDFCLLAHEVLHVCQFWLSIVMGDGRENEGEAYFHTHIMRQALEAMRAAENNPGPAVE